LGVVIELRNLVNFVLGFDVAVLGNPQINAHSVFRDVAPGEAGVGDRFIGAVDGNRTSPRTAADLFPLLVSHGIVVADPGQYVAHVAGFDLGDPRTALQQTGTKFIEIIAVGSRQPHTGNYDPVA